MIGLITLPSNFISLVSANTGTTFSDLAPVAMLIGGVFLGLFLIDFLIRAVRGKRDSYSDPSENETDEEYQARFEQRNY